LPTAFLLNVPGSARLGFTVGRERRSARGSTVEATERAEADDTRLLMIVLGGEKLVRLSY